MAKLTTKQVIEWLGILAVIGSLLLVAIEVNQNNLLLEEEVRISRAEGKQMSTSVYVGFVDLLLTNPEVRNVFYKSLNINNLDEFTEDESDIFSQLMLRAMFAFSDDHYRYSLGVLEPGEWEETLALLRNGYISNSTFLQWWEQTGKQFFAQRIIDLISAEMEIAEIE